MRNSPRFLTRNLETLPTFAKTADKFLQFFCDLNVISQIAETEKNEPFLDFLFEKETRQVLPQRLESALAGIMQLEKRSFDRMNRIYRMEKQICAAWNLHGLVESNAQRQPARAPVGCARGRVRSPFAPE